jgi:hypothetical protein
MHMHTHAHASVNTALARHHVHARHTPGAHTTHNLNNHPRRPAHPTCNTDTMRRAAVLATALLALLLTLVASPVVGGGPLCTAVGTDPCADPSLVLRASTPGFCAIDPCTPAECCDDNDTCSASNCSDANKTLRGGLIYCGLISCPNNTAVVRIVRTAQHTYSPRTAAAHVVCASFAHSVSPHHRSAATSTPRAVPTTATKASHLIQTQRHA